MTLLVPAVALVLGALAGCGSPAYDGTGTAACPALPVDLVAQVAGALSADGKGPDDVAAGPQSGSLPVVGQSTSGVRYRCQWGTRDGGTGLQVYVRDNNELGVREAQDFLRRQQGPELTAPVSGVGRAFRLSGNGSAQARWVCDFRTLQVDLFSPKGGHGPAGRRQAPRGGAGPRAGLPGDVAARRHRVQRVPGRGTPAAAGVLVDVVEPHDVAGPHGPDVDAVFRPATEVS